MNSIYDWQFRENILVVGKTSCGKTTFLQKLGINNFFGKLVKTEWVSGIEISESRKTEIQSCFDNPVEVHVAKEPDKLASLIETFKLRTRDLIDDDDNVNLNNSIFGENKKMDRLIVMDDVSGVADISKKFTDFLTVSRKYCYHCIYVFHIIAPATQIWQNIISQTNIFNIFPSSVPCNTTAKISSNCQQQQKKICACSINVVE